MEGDVATLSDEDFHPLSAFALQVGTRWFPALIVHLFSSFLPCQGRLCCIWFSIIHVLDFSVLIGVLDATTLPVIFHFVPIIDLYLQLPPMIHMAMQVAKMPFAMPQCNKVMVALTKCLTMCNT